MNNNDLRPPEIPPYSPAYDEKELKALLDRVGDRWKGVDADKYIAEIRGYEKTDIMNEIKETRKEEYVIKVECIHEQRNVNLGTRFCFKGDITKCDSCPFKEPGEIKSMLTYTTSNL